MKTFLSIVSIVIIFVSTFDVCPTPANKEMQTPIQWEFGSIYEISFSDGCPRINDKEVLLSAPLLDAIMTIQLDCNTAYGDFSIEYKYVKDEDIYIANLVDEFVEL